MDAGTRKDDADASSPLHGNGGGSGADNVERTAAAAAAAAVESGRDESDTSPPFTSPTDRPPPPLQVVSVASSSSTMSTTSWLVFSGAESATATTAAAAASASRLHRGEPTASTSASGRTLTDERLGYVPPIFYPTSAADNANANANSNANSYCASGEGSMESPNHAGRRRDSTTLDATASTVGMKSPNRLWSDDARRTRNNALVPLYHDATKEAEMAATATRARARANMGTVAEGAREGDNDYIGAVGENGNQNNHFVGGEEGGIVGIGIGGGGGNYCSTGDDFDLCSVFSNFTAELQDGDDDGPMHPPPPFPFDGMGIEGGGGGGGGGGYSGDGGSDWGGWSGKRVGTDYVLAHANGSIAIAEGENGGGAIAVPYGASHTGGRTGRGDGDGNDDDLTSQTCTASTTIGVDGIASPSVFSHLTEMTDRTEAMRQYRASSRCTEAIERNGLSDPAGFYVVCAVVFVGEMSRGITFPTLWPFVKRLGGTDVTQGYCIALYSLGRVVVSPIFGHVSVVRGYRVALASAVTLLAIGSVLYSQAEAWGGGNVGVLLAAQAVMGIGSGTLGVTRAYVAEVTPRGLRTRYLAFLTSFIYGGFTVTPILGAWLVWYFERRAIASGHENAGGENGYNDQDDDDYDGEESTLRLGPLRVNEYNAPGYILTASCALSLAAIVTKLNHERRNPLPRITKLVPSRVKRSVERTPAEALGMRRVLFGRVALVDAAVWSCLILNVVSKGCLSIYETMGVRLARDEFDLDSKYVGVTVSACGLVGVALLLCMRYIVRVLTDVQMIVGGLTLTVVGITGVIDFRGGDRDGDDDGDGAEGVGDVALGAGRFIVGMFFVFAVGFPLSDTANVGLFSKLAGNKPQGTLQGLLACSSSFARMAIPIVASYVTQYLSMKTLFVSQAAILICSALAVFYFRDTIRILST